MTSEAAEAEKGPPAADTEQTPLLAKRGSETQYAADEGTPRDPEVARYMDFGRWSSSPPPKENLPELVKRVLTRLHVKDSTTYETSELSSWSTLTQIRGSVWRRPSLWIVAKNVLLVATVVTCFVLLLVEDPARLNVHKFQKLGTFLNVFVGLLLGFFMSSSMKRWYACADGFMVIMDAIRDLQMELYALGAPEERIDNVLRYGVLSIRLLNMELHIEAMPNDQKQVAAEQMWDVITSSPELQNREDEEADASYGWMSDEEKTQLSSIDDPAAMIWIWIAQMIGRMAQDGDVPPMPSPTYGRLAAITVEAHGGIREVRSSISIQPPYIYVQMLAALVHVNNIINAISFGLTFGTMLGTVGSFYHLNDGKRAGLGQCLRDAQSLLVSFVLSVFGPLIYQALLEVTIAIAQPFSSADGEIPARKFVLTLEKDLHNGKKMANSLPAPWKKPCFRKPAGAA